ncbi:MAG: pyruvate synthase subunit beta [Deltaproteobacteria bacterium]|nr:pyruvate synthase subunit beta [Deltaproteobacteria bacterium]
MNGLQNHSNKNHSNKNQSSLIRSQNTNCAGCGMSVALNLLGDVLGNNVKMAIPACCGIVTAHSFPFSAYKVPVIASTFAASSMVAAGMKVIQELNHESCHVLAFAGDGGTFDIGLACLSSNAERNENIIYVCYDNEVYGNTGAQRSSATPLGASTTTTPLGKTGFKKDIMAIMAAHRIPYAATLSVGFPDDFTQKVRLASTIKGFRFLHILSPCTPNWKIEPSQTIRLARLAVETGVFPLYEVFEGAKYKVTIRPKELRPVEQYFSLQKRFSRMSPETKNAFERAIHNNWNRLLQLEEIYPA